MKVIAQLMGISGIQNGNANFLVYYTTDSSPQPMALLVPDVLTNTEDQIEADIKTAVVADINARAGSVMIATTDVLYF